jgi:hypothetical protein
LREAKNIVAMYFATKNKLTNTYRGSYGLKHDFEEFLRAKYPDKNNNYYISEHACIIAFLEAGFTFKDRTEHMLFGGNFNYFFNIARKDFDFFIEVTDAARRARHASNDGRFA